MGGVQLKRHAMSIEIVAQPLTYPSDLLSPPPDTNSFIQACADYTLYFLPADYRLCISGSNNNPPGPENRNKVYFKSNVSGVPNGTWFMYNGSWRLIYSGLPYELRFFLNSPTTAFDSTGLGLLGTRWDGWAICNGQNGTPDLRDKFLLSGNYAEAAFGWYTLLLNPVPTTSGGTITSPAQASGSPSGGSGAISLTVYNLPAINCSIPLSPNTAGGSQYYACSIPDGAESPGGPVGETFVTAVGSGSTPSIDIVPPYIAAGLAMFIGYSD